MGSTQRDIREIRDRHSPFSRPLVPLGDFDWPSLKVYCSTSVQSCAKRRLVK
jgi:hypothetical protein